MYKAGKHIQSGMNSSGGSASVGGAGVLASPPAANSQKNVINSIMSFLPDNRPITSLQIVEDFERCPKNFTPIHRTYDQDADADLWRDYNILFGRQTKRYLCLSKSEGLPEYVVETLKVIAEKIPAPKEFSLLSRTADTEHKAWRKRQIIYKLSKRGTVTQAVTDIILCSKLKIAPDGFKLAGDINGILVCYKTGAIPVRLPPPVPKLTSPQTQTATFGIDGGTEVEKALNRLNLNGNRLSKGPLPPVPSNDADHDYEEIQAYQLNSPVRPAPPRPISADIAQHTTYQHHSIGTLGTYTELEGVPFILNPALKQNQINDLPTLPEASTLLEQLDYDFTLERQTLCTMKSPASKNPFFN